MISVVITTYKEPEYLDLCLKSAIEGQSVKNQILVVVDGFYEINKEVLKKYEKYIDVLPIEENVGMIRAMNFGHYNVQHDLVFHVQDDNVFPKQWDEKLLKHYTPNSVLTPNQIEPGESIFRQFHIKNLGKNITEFDLNEFWNYEESVKVNKIDECGSTFPFLIHKIDYLKIGGLDESYPGPWVVDWEFFMKCRFNGLKMLRTYDCNFYHFVSIGTRTPEKIRENQCKELQCFEYFKYKWGKYPYNDKTNNNKSLQ